MRVAHSVWSKPALCGRWHFEDQLVRDLWSFALSAHYVKALGHELVLRTDDVGAQIFGILPYDEIRCTLDDLQAPDVFWAAGKIETLRIEPLGTVHIDGDVFIKRREVFDIIETDDYDLLVQSDQLAEAQTVSILRPYLVRFLPQLFDEENRSYNCGIVRFLHQELREEFTNAYRKILAYLGRSKQLISMMEQNRTLALDLVTEQRLLRALAESGDCNVRRITADPGGTLHIDADGYEHCMAMSKYLRLREIRQELKDENP
ncbi:MAG TPA: DUF6734 family protein, partial [Ktedonobacterales bacterium]|nr:DUF6734 family protein [Ktedonobacterales bacterium]